jgi:hypothetical protein
LAFDLEKSAYTLANADYHCGQGVFKKGERLRATPKIELVDPLLKCESSLKSAGQIKL